jgi:hypothetical protein
MLSLLVMISAIYYKIILIKNKALLYNLVAGNLHKAGAAFVTLKEN